MRGYHFAFRRWNSTFDSATYSISLCTFTIVQNRSCDVRNLTTVRCKGLRRAFHSVRDSIFLLRKNVLPIKHHRPRRNKMKTHNKMRTILVTNDQHMPTSQTILPSGSSRWWLHCPNCGDMNFRFNEKAYTNS